MTAHRKSPSRPVCVECWKRWPCPSSGACQHGMPTPASCIDCMDDGNLPPPPPPPPVLPDGDPFRAKFPGECPDCSLPINTGDLIIRWTDDRYRHTRCTP